MSRIEQCFADLRTRKKKALIPYITAGDPQPDVTVPAMHAMVSAGADLLEVGVPFSDPMADGPVIQAACERALRHHVTLHTVLDMVRDFRKDNTRTPVILMGYLNPIEVWGYAAFAEAAADAGVDGILTVDMPPEEAAEFTAAMRDAAIDTIFLLSPTSDDTRMQKVSEAASGFIYYVSFKGVTGANRLEMSSVAGKLKQLRQHTKLPVGVGFGIRDADTAGQVAVVADAVVVGSVLVQQIAGLAERPESIPATLAATVAELRAGIDAAVQ
jgi:tryptophan synthase alpha chain